MSSLIFFLVSLTRGLLILLLFVFWELALCFTGLFHVFSVFNFITFCFYFYFFLSSDGFGFILLFFTSFLRWEFRLLIWDFFFRFSSQHCFSLFIRALCTGYQSQGRIPNTSAHCISVSVSTLGLCWYHPGLEGDMYPAIASYVMSTDTVGRGALVTAEPWWELQ